MKKYEVMSGIFGESEFIEGSFDTLEEANYAAESLAYRIIQYGKHSKIKHTYCVYVAETITDEECKWGSTESAAGGYSATVEGII